MKVHSINHRNMAGRVITKKTFTYSVSILAKSLSLKKIIHIMTMHSLVYLSVSCGRLNAGDPGTIITKMMVTV